MGPKIRFANSLSVCDPADRNVVIAGQVPHLSLVAWDVLSVKLSPRVEKRVFDQAVSTMSPNQSDACSLFFNSVFLASLPSKCSRHNAPSQCHALAKVLKGTSVADRLDVVLVCERRDVFAIASAVARAFPVYSRKSSSARLGAGARNPDPLINVEFLLVGEDEAGAASEDKELLSEEDLKLLEDLADSVQLTARIVDTPCSDMNTMHFLGEIEKVAASLPNVRLTVIKGEDLNTQGFGGIYSVGRAAENPPVLAVLSHKPTGAKSTIAWVGKGIVYDTGGLSIKGKTSMPGMKRDCGGAAAVLGAFSAVVKQGFEENLHAVFCLAENAVGPKATRPDDIITMFSGRTVEINNTDAEGRLVLADGVSYAHKVLHADVILDMATLTGAQGIATGKYHGALITNDEAWEAVAVKAGRLSGDLLHPLPYAPELHFSEFNSALADMKNSVSDRNNAQASCAALFVASHLGFDTNATWLHVDMAHPVASGERATGYGVTLLTVLFGKYTKSPLLKAISPLTNLKTANVKIGAEVNADADDDDDVQEDSDNPAKKIRLS